MGAFFEMKKNLMGVTVAEEAIVINNSVTVTLGGLVRFVVSGNPTANNGRVCEDAIAGESFSGVCVGIVTKDEVALDNADSSEFDGTRAGTSGLKGSETYAAAADNLTDKQVKARIQLLTYWDVLTNTPDAALGTTDGSDTAFNYTDVATTVQVDENNAAAAFTTVAQLLIHGVNPDDTSEGLYRPKELQEENG